MGGPESILGPVGLMDEPATIAFEDDADAYVDWLTDLLFGSDTDSEEDENADAELARPTPGRVRSTPGRSHSASRSTIR